MARTGRAAQQGVNAALAARARAAGAPRRELDATQLAPMLAETAERPFSQPGWLFEPKYDGVRVLAVRRRTTGVRLLHRSQRDATHSFPEIVAGLAQLPCDDFVLDGEIVALDARGVISFEQLQKRLGLRQGVAISGAKNEIPVVMFCFDLLSVAGYDLRDLPLARRKDFLRLLVSDTGWVRYGECIEGHGEALFETIKEQGWEGIVAKREASTYRCGRRSRDWLKIKALRTADVVVVGFVRGKGSRRDLGALMVAWQQNGELVYAGNVGTGLSMRTIQELLPRLERSKRPLPAFRGSPPGAARAMVFVVPELVAEVRYAEVTAAGYLRQPVFLRLREDKPIAECCAPRAAVVRRGAAGQKR